jgi:hypothetical protein
MVLKTGKTGLDGPDDFELIQGSKDDGESWAGGKILKVMQNMAVIDAVVIVSRWCVLLIINFFRPMSFCRRLNIHWIIGMEERFSVQRDFRI